MAFQPKQRNAVQASELRITGKTCPRRVRDRNCTLVRALFNKADDLFDQSSGGAGIAWLHQETLTERVPIVTTDALAIRVTAGSLVNYLNVFAKEHTVIKKISSFLLFAGFAVGNVCAATPAQPVAEKLSTLQWRMSLAADGSITALVPRGEGLEVLRPRLEQAVKQWEFAPGSLNGKPAATETLLSVQVALTPSADAKSYAVTIRDARTGGGVSKAEPPRFSALVVKKLMGRSNTLVKQVVVEVSYDDAGKATDVAVAAGSPVADGPLLDSVERAMRKSRFDPERVNGVAVAGKILTTICIAISMGGREARKLARTCAAWSLPGSGASVDQGQSLAMESSVELKTSVVGSLL